MKKCVYHILICLSAISCTPNSNYPDIEKEFQLFRKVSEDHSGIDFINELIEDERSNIIRYPYFYNGGGVAIADLNNDSLPDVFFTGNMKGDRLYFNQGGLKFKEVSIKAQILQGNLWTTGVTIADVNNDGWLDMYVCRSGDRGFRNNLLYVNQQNGKFKEQAKIYGLNDNGNSVQASFFDFDLDGDLDMYLVNHSNRFFSSQEELFSLKHSPHPDEADKLYQNNGDGSFKDISLEAGINHFAFGLSATISDLNNDGFPDIYAASDFFEPDFMYINNGNGTFTNLLEAATGHISFSSMGTDIADFNNDGFQDIMVCDMQAADNYRKKANMATMDPARFERIVAEGYHYQYMLNTLQLNSGYGRFSEIAELAGVSETDWSWGPLFLDMDNDGWKDLFVSNGIRRDIQFKDAHNKVVEQEKSSKVRISLTEIIESFPVQKLQNYTFINNQDLTFSNRTELSGIDHQGFSTGAAYADLDLDGDLDLILNNIDEVASIYENLASQRGNHSYIQIALRGVADNFWGIGAKVEIHTNGLTQHFELQLTRGFQSAVEPIVHAGLGSAEIIDEIVVQWPNGTFNYLKNVTVNQRITLRQGNDKPIKKGHIKPLITQVIDVVNYKHQDESYNDFANEVLLPHKYSQLGPGITVGDVNNDGLDDFYIGGSKGHAGKLFVQDVSGAFSHTSESTWFNDKHYEDIDAVFLDSDGDGDLDLYIVSGSNEWEPAAEEYLDRFYINNGKGLFKRDNRVLPAQTMSGSSVRAGDYDNDGDLDLFVGGRLVPGQYPMPASSLILENIGGKFNDATKAMAPELIAFGMVTDALWTDFDKDNDLDLIVVGEWMPITLFENVDGKLTIKDIPGFANTHGWWYSISEGDMDNDGDLDYVAGNLGLNYKYKASMSEPFQVYADDFDNNGKLDIVLGYFNEGTLFPVRGKQCSSQQLPFLKSKFPQYADFASSTLLEIYGNELLDEALHLHATTFASVYINNLGNGTFQLQALPNEAQFSSINGIVVEDIDNDGFQDLIVAGNMYTSEVETARNDASVGLVLKGEGKGLFSPLPVSESGFFAPGDVKSLAKMKAPNGSSMILVGNNSNLLQLFKTNLEDNRPIDL